MFEVFKMLYQKNFSGYEVFTKLQHFEGSRVRAGRKSHYSGRGRGLFLVSRMNSFMLYVQVLPADGVYNTDLFRG